MKSTKLLTIVLSLYLINNSLLRAQCSLITKNGSSQDPKTVCAPVDFTMDVWYKFLIPVDTTKVTILFVWNDGTGATTTVHGHWNTKGDSVWAEASHVYPPDDECSKTADAYLVFDGDECTSSGHQSQTFSTWGTDNENGGSLSTDPPVAYFCEGEDIKNVTFRDNSVFNCNISIEPDNPNRYYRWVQFIYNTYTQGGSRIPNATVKDSAGVVHKLTDAKGNFVSSFSGPIVKIPLPADGPNQVSYPISAPAGAVAGDILEITMRNWNVCNPYDNIPTDGIPPADPVNGDNPPITKTARIEIIAPPPIVVSSLFEFCTGENIVLNASADSAQVRWYSDSLLTHLLHTGNTYNPQNAPFNLNNSIPGNYTFWVTSFEGVCESAPSKVNLNIYQTPSSVSAGSDQTLCSDTARLDAIVPSVGTGKWSTTGSATIDDIHNPKTVVRNLIQGANTFTWTVTNGPCNTSNDVTIYSDRQPAPANAGSDQNICGTGAITLNASPPTKSGKGYWLIIQGGGTLSDSTSPTAQLSHPSSGSNKLIWRVSSLYGACPVTNDTVSYFIDLPPGNAFAGYSSRVCEISSVGMTAKAPLNGGYGRWKVLTGSTHLSDTTDPAAIVDSLQPGSNSYKWTVRSKYGLCPSSTDSVTFIRDLSPGIANAGNDQTFCLENTDTLNANAPFYGNGTWKVITNPSGTSPIFSPNTSDPTAIFSINPGNEGLYRLSWTLKNGSCISSDTVDLDFGVPPPPANAGPDTEICGQIMQLNGNKFALGTGTWKQLTGPGTVVFSPGIHSSNPTISVAPGEEGTYTFEWRLSSGACSSTADTVKVVFKPFAPNPIVTGAASCGPDSLTLHAVPSDVNDHIQWFLNAGDLLPASTNEKFITPVLSATRNYYASSIDTITGCSSSRVPIAASIYPVPGKPVLHGDTLCGAGNAILSGSFTAPANALQWSSDSAGSSILGQNNILTVPVSVSSYFWGRALDTVHGCISEPDSVIVVVYPSVPSPTPLSDTSCGPSDFMLKAVKSSPDHFVRWYAFPSGGGPISIADSMYVPIIDSTRSYWISEWNDSTGCFSSRVKITAQINPVPNDPELQDTSSCGAASFTLKPGKTANASTFHWYSQPTGGALIKAADSLQTGLLSSNTSYWVAGYNEISHCEGHRKQVDITLYPLPAPLTISGPTLVLKDQNGVIFATNGATSSTYSWTIPSGVTLNQNMNDFVRLDFPTIGSYDLSVYEVTSHGCIGPPTSHPVTVVNDSIAVDIGAYDQNACTGVNFAIKPYLFGGTPPYTYSWTGDVAYLSSTSSLFTTFSPPGTGTYKLKLKVVDVNLRSATDSVQITVYTSPEANIEDDSAIVCVGNNYKIQVQTSGSPAASHLWSGPIQSLSSYTVQDPIYTPHQPDTVVFHYQLTDIHGCKAYDSIHIYSDIPVAYFELETQPGCSPLNMKFNNLSQRAVHNSWDFGDGSVSTATSPSHLYINQSPEIKYYPVKLDVTSILGCTSEFTQYAMVWPNPQASLDAIPDNACSPAEIRLFSTPGNMRYYWDFGDSSKTTTSAFNTSHLYALKSDHDTVFTAKVITESSLNCVDSAFLNLDIFATPQTEFTVFPATDTFPNSSFKLTDLTPGTRWNYSWSLGNGKTMSVKDPGTINYDAPGNYTVTLAASSPHCSDSTSKTIYLYPAKPIAKFAGVEPGCMPHTVNFINNSEYASSYLWEFGDGSVSTARDPEYTYYQAGTYPVTLTVKGDGGEASYTDTAKVYVLPNSYFNLAPRHVYVNDAPVNFFNLSKNADIMQWDFGDGTTSDETNPKHVYKQAGTYDVTLKVWTKNNCYDLYVMKNAVLVQPTGTVKFPNAFRPDSPLEENRIFKPAVIDHVEHYHLMIFNRWGELVFESFDQDTGWDGTFNGKPAKQDVYIWKVKGTYSDGRGFIKTGDVTLLY